MECTHLNSVGCCSQKAAEANDLGEQASALFFVCLGDFCLILFRFFEIGFLCVVLAVLKLTL